MKCSPAQFDCYLYMSHSPRGTKYAEQFVDGKEFPIHLEYLNKPRPVMPATPKQYNI